MKTRPASIDDLNDLNVISVQSKKYWGYPDAWIEKWKEDLTINEQQFSQQSILVLEISEQIIGFCSIIKNDLNYEILHLWILPVFIGKGYGKKLLEDAIQKYTKADKPIIVIADPNAESFYQKHGFITFDRVESFPKGRFLPVMRKDVS